MDLETPLSSLPGIGFFMGKRLEKLELFTLEDLIFHFPFRYDDYSVIKPADETQIGEVVTLQGEIWSIKNIYTRYGRVLTQAIFNDGTSPIMLTWFNQSYLIKSIKAGDKLQISGKLAKYKNKLSIMVPQWERVGANLDHPEGGLASHLHTGRLVPVYSETSGVASKWLRTKIDKYLPVILNKLQDPLPDKIRDNMLILKDALAKIHFPKDTDEIDKARERLGFDELFYVSLATQKTRLSWQEKPITKAWKVEKKDLDRFISSLPFKLTSAQIKVITEITSDIKRKYPMNRLLQGEVGSGKTVVAALFIYLAHLNGYSSLFMAPTEILAWQHFETVSGLLEPFGITVGIYTGSRKFTKPYTLNPKPSVIIGTHALLSDKLAAKNVGLVIIDEQHRFGVAQRTKLRQKGLPVRQAGPAPHFLTMTATPIPRTVALTVYGDLDLSIIDEMPKGRLKIKTYVVPEQKRKDSYGFIAKHVLTGEQAYIITPLIEESETLVSVRAAKKEFENLKKIFPRFNLGLLHGRMKAKEKEQIIGDFRSNKIQILVSTSVVEVGMDIANATIMVIEGAERYGLAQLHQLRGRIGRGSKESFCLLYTTHSSVEDSKRLKYLETTFDGLKLAELDLKIRGSGTIFSTAQHGRFEFKIARLSDLPLIEKTRQAARDLLIDNLELDKYPNLRAQLQKISAQVMPD
ncbi:MAG: ATP-dependent DNA helicase RecG [Microgenomates group bacterium Gr01-1014_7]|nr:MAG: ATP-dependent DNA helicase RecG [Microgenomates group bacterium Gr01-1014_7]